MARRPFEKVSAGPGQIYESEYNAFLDVARRARGGQDVDLTKIAKGVVVPCVNRTETDFLAFDVVALGVPVVTPELDADEFKYKTPVFKLEELDGGRRLSAPLQSWGVLQSACTSGGSSRVMVSGISPVRIQFAVFKDDVAFPGPFGLVTGTAVTAFFVGDCEILAVDNAIFELTEDAEAEEKTLLGMIRFPVIHHELLKATALEAMPYDADTIRSVTVNWNGTDWNTAAYNDWLNITINKGDRVHLGYFADKQRLSVITCCSIGSGAATSLGCPCLQGVGNGVCNIIVTFDLIERDLDSLVQQADDACKNGANLWNGTKWRLFPPINDPNACEFLAQDTQNPKEPDRFNAFEEFPCSAPEDSPTYMVLNGSCTSEDDNEWVLDLFVKDIQILQAKWEDLSYFEGAAARQPAEVIVFPRNIIGSPEQQLSDARVNRAANTIGNFDPDTATPALQDGVGTQCDTYDVAPSRVNPDDEVDYDFGSGQVRNVPLRDGDVVVYHNGRWVRITKALAVDGGIGFAPCEVDGLTDPYGYDWLNTASTPSIDLEFEQCPAQEGGL